MSNNGDKMKNEVAEELIEDTEDMANEARFRIVERQVIVDGSRKAVLASVGAVAVLQEGSGDWFNNLVKRGEEVEQSSREQFRKAVNRPQKEAKRLGDGIGQQFDKMLAWLNIPTRSDIQNLNEKVTVLTKKVEELQEAKVESGEVQKADDVQPEVEETT